MEEADGFKVYFGHGISRIVTGKGLGPWQVCPGTVWNKWVFTLQERSHDSSPGDVESTFIKAGDSETGKASGRRGKTIAAGVSPGGAAVGESSRGIRHLRSTRHTGPMQMNGQLSGWWEKQTAPRRKFCFTPGRQEAVLMGVGPCTDRRGASAVLGR
uniref:Uncharacterized protein n=1 Tax=Molossus molossus TaxID=27622 RepID=A0A7J8FS03_MOLMO|nr:hypothetical protein HJG59_008324 [Molossus molossus]